MKQFFLLLIFVGWYIAYSIPVFGHPLDISNTSFTLYERSIEGVTYIHPVQLDRILSTRGSISPTAITVETYYSLTGVLTKYLEETILVENNNESCKFTNFAFQEGLMIDEIFGRGFPISYSIYCLTPLTSPKVTIRFLTEVPLQTNKLNIYQSVGNGDFKKIDYSILNIRKDSLSLTLGQEKVLKDSDNDGITDEDELLYGTNPNLKDSDNDGYSDWYEIQNSWSPISGELGPGQKPRDQITISPLNENSNSRVLKRSANEDTLANDTAIWGGVRFTQVLREIRIYIDNVESSHGFWALLISIAFLGFLHALGPGHSKGILISQILDKNIGVMKGSLYAGLFSIVHLLDIIVVVLISRFLFNYIDTSIMLSYIQKGSIFLILIVGIYLLGDAIRRYQKPVEDKKNGSRNYLVLAIITGLTPCAFGWSIFLMLLAVGKGILAIPFLISLGIGIFLCLFSFVIITTLFREGIFTHLPKIGRISPIISSIFILLIGSSLLIQNF